MAHVPFQKNKRLWGLCGQNHDSRGEQLSRNEVFHNSGNERFPRKGFVVKLPSETQLNTQSCSGTAAKFTNKPLWGVPAAPCPASCAVHLALSLSLSFPLLPVGHGSPKSDFFQHFLQKFGWQAGDLVLQESCVLPDAVKTQPEEGKYKKVNGLYSNKWHLMKGGDVH